MVNNSVAEGILNLKQLVSQDGGDVESITQVLQKLTGLMRCPETRCELSNELWEPVIMLAKASSHTSSKNNPADGEIKLLIELLRFLRNCCSGSQGNQNFILSNMLDFAKLVLRSYLPKEASNEVLALKICIQLFGNILVGNENSKSYMWSIFFDENYFRLLLQHKDQTVQECTMMVLFNCMCDETAHRVLNTKEGHEILLYVTNTLLQNQIDWGILFIECLLKHEDFFTSYPVLPLTNRLLILDIVAERLKSSQDDGYFSISVASIEKIRNMFWGYVSQLYTNVSDMDPSETVSTLSILCTASISDAYISILQNNKDFFKAIIECLKCIHILGKESCNVFSSLSETKHMSSQFSAEIAGHPLYGFKKNLIRLIGNLCYNCRDNQDLVRQLDGIPLVFDCCKFDAKNPYITQWCILAIRNIMENNAENQAILAGMSKSGEIVDSKILQEIGLQLQNDQGKLHIRSKPLC